MDDVEQARRRRARQAVSERRVVIRRADDVNAQIGDQWPSLELPIASAHTAQSLRAWRLLMASIGFTDANLELAMQRWLRRLGYYTEHWLLDGRFGVESISALQRFLSAKGLYLHAPDGWRGPVTVRAEIRYLNDQRTYL